MTIRENERNALRGKSSSDLLELAMDIVKDDPKLSNSRLVSRWSAQVEDDRSLLDAALEAYGHHTIVIARNTLERKKAKPKSKAATSAQRQQVTTSATRVVGKMLDRVLDLKTENGKRVRACSGTEINKLESRNASRAMLYREIGKYVKGKQVVGDVIDKTKGSAVLDKIGDVRKLVKLFD